jgi:DNA polymerase-3 subunit delta'
MELLLNERTATQLSAAINMAGGSLFYGRPGMGKATVALGWARQLNCAAGGCAQSAISCDHCRQIDAGVYPDLIVVQPDEKGSIGVAAVRDLSGLLSNQPYFADSVRVIIIDQAETMTISAQNALLKLLEEPPPRTRFILVAAALEALIITVRSRLNAVYFAPITKAALAEWLQRRRQVPSAVSARLAELAMGAPGTAARLAADPKAVADLERTVELAQSLESPSLFDGLRAARQLAAGQTDFEIILATGYN